MLPDPLHPAIVHFPIVLAILVPIAAIVALVLIRRGKVTPLVGWGAVAGLALLLFGSSWLAVETGEEQEERVEDTVGESLVEGHGERAEWFLILTGGVVVLSGLGLARGRIGQAGRGLATAAALALVPAGYLVGHSGGELVYKHGAAQAYLGPDGSGPRVTSEASARSDKEDDDDDR